MPLSHRRDSAPEFRLTERNLEERVYCVDCYRSKNFKRRMILAAKRSRKPRVLSLLLLLQGDVPTM
jgi:hypothetical protein